MTAFHCALALVAGRFVPGVRIETEDGAITGIDQGTHAQAGDVQLTTVVPGFVNAHSHAFHRLLRGRTHDDGGDFWQWRTRMYAEAGALTPDGYRDLATRVFTEMRDAGYTSVAEFHYVHHRPDGTPYPAHDMEIALADAAASAGIRLLLLDTVYLRGGVGAPLAEEQRRFGDGDVHGWLARWHALRDALAGHPLTELGAAVHSVRAVEPTDLAAVAAGLPAEVPLHVHVSEQPAENEQCLAAHGVTPTQLLAAHGLVTERLSAVHATHLTDLDIQLLGAAGATIVMCPTTEADLGDGIGPAPELLAAGARLAIGSDQNAVIDPWEETARLELDQRLRLQRRGVFSPAQLWRAGSATDGFRVGDAFDAVEVDTGSTRTWGADVHQLPLVARSGDVTATIVAGRMTRPQER
ncbi:formimidoylglutamate deiminase [Microbacterium mangrovi]|uniref:formimidoylglutamate deiminase n=1 Tax=Microbacterium mangrovi TaxID=1348253 RepID=UPI000690982C|nr:formimidoylglutamate deiminase [Microbacterium mangrovi]